jgi:hypothetical protein
MRDLIIARIEEIGYPMMIPHQNDLVKWRKPKDPMERMTRQMVWAQKSFDEGRVPLGHEVDMLDDDILLLMFERGIRDNARGTTRPKPVLAKPVPRPLYEIPNPRDHDMRAVAVEFEIYDPIANRYALPNMGEVRKWAEENCAGGFDIRGTFVLFDFTSDAMLVYLRFK